MDPYQFMLAVKNVSGRVDTCSHTCQGQEMTMCVQHIFWANYNDVSRRVVTLNGGLIRELPQNPLNSGLGIILIVPDILNISPPWSNDQ